MKGFRTTMLRRSSTAAVLATVLLLSMALGALPSGQARVLAAATPRVVYGDALANGWQDWSWGEPTLNFGSGSPVHGGSAAIEVTYTEGWSGLQLGRNESALQVGDYDTFRSWIHGGTAGGQTVEVVVANGSSEVRRRITPTAGQWTRIDLLLWDLVPSEATTIQWFNATDHAQPVFYIDDVGFVDTGATPPPPPPPARGPNLKVDLAAGRHPISPLIYGMNFTDEALAAELRLPIRRWGGNATTRYNWKTDTQNRGMDWFFENVPNDNPNRAALPDGSVTDLFVEQDRRTGTQSLLTLPLIGWTPKDDKYACGFSVAKYGPQQSTDSWRPDCGNGVKPNGQANITGNNPKDTSIKMTPAMMKEWIQHLVAKYGKAGAGGVRYYNLDNEPMLWPDTHRDVHPEPTSYDEMRDRTYQYASALKAADPGAKTLGPVVWGWTAYFWSALDWADEDDDWWNHPPDRLAHGNTPFLEWYLQQMKTYEQSNGTRILDYLDVHNYPQAGGVSLGTAGNSTTQALRLRSTRSLWDPTYTDESWIGEPVKLIPRLKAMVKDNYPGTKIAITEYNWGGLEHINGALAQADVLGIFGRESLDLATLWAPPTSSQPGAYAFRMFRNYDGKGGDFGDTAVQATSGNQDKLAVYAAQRSRDGATTVMVINKATGPLTSTLTLKNMTLPNAAQVYRYSTANLGAIVREANQPIGASGFETVYPASSITLYVLAAPAAPSLTIGDLVVNEGTGPATQATATVRLSAASTKSITVNFGTDDRTAIARADYSAVQGKLTFAPGVTERTITVPIKADAVDESNERLAVNLVNPVGATIKDAEGLITIRDDD